MLYSHARSSVVRLCLCVLLATFPLLTSPTDRLLAQPAESLSAGVIPTMGINDVTEGTLLFKTNQRGRYIPAPILKTDVQIAVTDIVDRATVCQEFTNPSQKKGDWLEGIYVFSFPETAAVDHLRMHVGDRIIEGQIKERGEAKKVYEKAKQEGKRTSLVEQERPNIFTTSVANIGPGERIIIVEIEYQETVRYDQGTFQLRFPMAIGQRYIPGTPVIVEDQDPNGSGTMLDTDRVPDASRITPPVQKPGQGSINPVSLSLSLTPGFPVAKVESLFHPVIVIPDPDGGYHISLKKDAVPADRVFQLTWSPAPSTEPTATILTEQRDGETYAMLMLVPPTQQRDATPFMPRDLTFVIDTSGSMAGPSIEQAKASLAAALTRLTTQDRVNVIQFNNTVRSVFSSPQPVTTAAMRKAIRYVEGLSADGGTEMLPALRQALKSTQDSTRLQQIVITDGQVGNEDELFELLHHRLGTRRVFTIGIGSTPNSHLMRKTAEIGRGTFTYVGNVSEVKNKLDALFKKLERPVLNDIQLDRTGWAGLEQYPSRIADLYEGEPVILTVKATSLPDQAILLGQMGTQPWSLPLSMKQTTNRGGLSVYWARQKISALMDEAFTGAAAETVRKGVLDIALAHHLVSKYTSLVAVDVTPAHPVSKPETELPQGTKSSEDQEKTAMIGLPKTGTNGQLQLLLGLLLLAAAAILWQNRSKLA